MEKTFKVPNIGCDGCVNTIKAELGELDGISRVDGDVTTKMVTVEYSDASDWQKIQHTLQEIEYPPQEG